MLCMGGGDGQEKLGNKKKKKKKIKNCISITDLIVEYEKDPEMKQRLDEARVELKEWLKKPKEPQYLQVLKRSTTGEYYLAEAYPFDSTVGTFKYIGKIKLEETER